MIIVFPINNLPYPKRSIKSLSALSKRNPYFCSLPSLLILSEPSSLSCCFLLYSFQSDYVCFGVWHWKPLALLQLHCPCKQVEGNESHSYLTWKILENIFSLSFSSSTALLTHRSFLILLNFQVLFSSLGIFSIHFSLLVILLWNLFLFY